MGGGERVVGLGVQCGVKGVYEGSVDKGILVFWEGRFWWWMGWEVGCSVV